MANRSKLKLGLIILAVLAVVYAVLAYVLLPAAWTHYEHQKGLAGFSMLTRTAQGIPGDPINVGLVGSKEDVVCAMHAAGWFPADPITLRTSIEIVGSIVFDRAYDDAPVSHLYFQDRREDLAFESPDGKSPMRRNHVRFWKVLDRGDEGRVVWLGAATRDRGIGFSRYTGQVTHHIAPNVDAERDRLTDDLVAARVVVALYEVTGIGPTLNGRNGERDLYYTDGEVKISRLVDGCGKRAETTAVLDNPPLVELKGVVWRAISQLLPAEGAADRQPQHQ